MLYLKDDTLNFNFSETVHNEARCRIDFKRTLRIPDDNNYYPLPPSLGRFVLRNTEDYKETIAEKRQRVIKDHEKQIIKEPIIEEIFNKFPDAEIKKIDD